MKKIISIALSLVLCFLAAGCSSYQTTDSSNKSTLAKEGLWNVTITVPAEYGDKETTQESLDEEVEENGWKSATLNVDGSVTYVMSRIKQKEYLIAMEITFEENMSDYFRSKGFTYVTAIKPNDDFTEFTVYTMNSEPDYLEEILQYLLISVSGYYNAFAGYEIDEIKVIYKNSNTDKIIDLTTLSLQEWQQMMEETSEED